MPMKKKTLFGDVLETMTRYFFILIAIVVLLILASCIRVVESGDVAVVLRFGKLVGNTREEQVREPGLHFAFPYLIDEVITIPVDEVIEQEILTYHASGRIIGNEYAGYLLTGDMNVAVLSASVKYTISDPVAYALHVNGSMELIDFAVSSAMLAEAAGMDVDGLLTDKKAAFASAVLERAAESIDRLGIGVSLSTLELTRVAMPEEVRDIYEQVNAETVRAATLLEQANIYASTTKISANSEKTSTISAATVAANNKITAANQELVEFYGLLEEYRKNPDLVEARVFSEKFTKMLKAFGKVIVVESEDTKVVLTPEGGG